MKKKITIGLVVVLSVAALAWLYYISTRPLPGEVVLDNNRQHVPEGSPLTFKMNPPTSGNHYPSWITKGFYDEPRPDGNVVHSEEHGYIIIWYDCEKKLAVNGVILNSLEIRPIFDRQELTNRFRVEPGMTGVVNAQSLPMTGGSEGSPSAKLADMPKSFSDGSCRSMKNGIKDILKQVGGHKMIAMPRVNMDSPIILTAWGRMEKLNSLETNKIKDFVNAFRDNGPEQTVEP